MNGPVSVPISGALAVARTADVLAQGDREDDCPGIQGAELRRLRSLRRPADRDDALAAHLLVRQTAARALGIREPWRSLPLEYRCPDCGSDEHGIPSLRMPGATVRSSISHAHGIVAAAVGGIPGVDVESVTQLAATDPALWLAASERARADSEPDYAARAWTIKESLIKVGQLRLDALTGFDARPVIDAALAAAEWTSPDGARWWSLSRIDGDAAVAAVSSVPIRFAQL